MPTLRRNPRIAWREEPEERERILAALERGEDAGDRGWVILVDGGLMHRLNLVAGEIWCLADGSRGIREIARILAGRYDAPVEEIERDVERFVEECLRRGWLTAEGG